MDKIRISLSNLQKGRDMPMIYNRQMETMPRKEIEALQLERLRHLVRYCYDNVKLYHDRFDAAGLDPDKFKTLSDLQNIPPTTKADVRDN